jgi:hypothetical protein
LLLILWRKEYFPCTLYGLTYLHIKASSENLFVSFLLQTLLSTTKGLEAEIAGDYLLELEG